MDKGGFFGLADARPEVVHVLLLAAVGGVDLLVPGCVDGVVADRDGGHGRLLRPEVRGRQSRWPLGRCLLLLVALQPAHIFILSLLPRVQLMRL